VINGERKGPMSIDELINTPELTKDTYVWNENMPQWEHAGNVDALKPFFEGNLDHYKVEEPAVETVATDKAQLQQEESAQHTQEATQAKKAWYEYGELPDMKQCPPTFLVLSIIMLLCCCTPFGIVAVVYASQVRSLYLSRQYEKAEKYSRNALIWCVVALFAGMFYIPISILWSIYSVLL
ncbi:MAG: CD225/dispanin family protein, partial [Muribaculaceae bacterium]|nr:CD225/dispanin family protein [Muribaculaceae bacterium]